MKQGKQNEERILPSAVRLPIRRHEGLYQMPMLFTNSRTSPCDCFAMFINGERERAKEQVASFEPSLAVA